MVSYGGIAWKKVVVIGSAILALCGSGSAQTFNLYEGLGALENAWQDWSWCTDNFNSTSILYDGLPSVQVTYAGAYQGFELVSSSSFPAEYFAALHFSVNGGTTAGRAIQLSLMVNGSWTSSANLNTFIQGGSVRANEWSSVVVPLSAFGIKPTDEISAFLLQESSGQAQPSFWVANIGWLPNAAPTPVKVTVNVSSSLRTVDQKMFGANTAMWDTGLSSTTCKSLIKNAGFKAFRFPGGSASDDYNWATNSQIGATWTWATNFDQFASVAVPLTAGECFITANYGTGTPAMAAAWVKYSNITKRYGMKYWEVGNEVYGTWEQDSHPHPNDPVTYATEFAQYYKQMKAIDPSIKIGAVSTPGEDSFVNYSSEVVTNPVTHQQHSGWTPVMLATMKSLKVTPDFIIYHRYPEYANDCDFTLLIGNSGWYSDMDSLRAMLVDYLGAANTQTQIMCTENNCDAGPEGKQMCSLVNGVFMADTFGTVLQTECNSFLWWDLINGQDTTADNGPWLYGWRMYGDEGVMSPDFTQTYPVYYMEQLVNEFAEAGDDVVPTTSSYGLLTAFATKRSGGTVRVMVVNKNPTVELTTQIAFTGFTPVGTATLYTYGMTQDNAAMNGKSQAIGVSTIKSVSKTMTMTIPPYSVSVIVFH